MMSVSAKKVVAKLKGEAIRGQQTLYLDLKLLKEFKANCKSLGISSNKALEELMREFIQSAKTDPKPKK